MASQMRITLDIESQKVVVTDEKGNPVKEALASSQNPMEILRDKSVITGGLAAIVFTRSNPTCVWFWWGGNWYVICV